MPARGRSLGYGPRFPYRAAPANDKNRRAPRTLPGSWGRVAPPAGDLPAIRRTSSSARRPRSAPCRCAGPWGRAVEPPCNLPPRPCRRPAARAPRRVRGAVRERLGDDKGAVVDYTEALQRDPKDPRIYMARSAVYVRLKMYAESLEDRQQAVQLDPKNPEVYVARGGSYHLLGQHDKGIEDRTRAIGLSPASPLGWTARGYAYFLLERWDEALSDLDQAVKLDPKNAETRQLWAQAQSHVEEKIKQARAKELAPETGNVQLPVPVDAPATPVTPGRQPAVAVPTSVKAPAAAPAAAAPKVAKVLAPPPAKPVPTVAEFVQQGRKLIQEEHFAEAIEPLTPALKSVSYTHLRAHETRHDLVCR